MPNESKNRVQEQVFSKKFATEVRVEGINEISEN